MILVTTGTQLPFPRLVGAVAALVAEGRLDEPVIAQVGPDAGAYPGLEVHADLPADRFEALFARARLVVGHAGIGTVLSARRHGRPLVAMPRRADLGEHRNDHQMATARELADRPGLHVAWDADALGPLLTGPTPPGPPAADDPDALPEGPRAALVAHLRGLVDGA